jgi:PKD repeat protein
VTCNDDAEVTATLSVNDGHHVTPVTSQTHISIANANPVITSMSLPTTQVALNAPVNLNAVFSDASSNDSHTGTIDWGDTVGGAVVNDGAHTATGSHSYSTAGTYTVRLTVQDDNGGLDTKMGTVVVKGLPTADAHGPYSGYEGLPPGTPAIQLTGTASDPAHETFSWNFTEHFTKAGTSCVYTGQTTLTPTISCNDNAVIDAQLVVTDSLNQSTTSNPTTVTVSNAAPVVAVPNVSAPPVVTGQMVSADSSFTDAGTNDHHTATINWGDGSPIAPATVAYSGPGAGHASATHPYAAPGDYIVTLTVTDDDGASSSRSKSVHVNGPPIVTVNNPYAGFEGTPAQLLDVTASDPDNDPLTTHWSITYTGDPGVHCDLTGADSLTPSILCDDDATVTATVSVSDGVYAPVIRTTTVNIGNVSPVAGSVSLSSTLVTPGQNVTVSLPYTDAGTHDTHTVSIDWGDGNTTTPTPSEAPDSGSGSVTGSHAYSGSGQFQIVITIADDDNGAATVTVPTSVRVNNIPVASAGGAYSGVEGTTVTLSASATDADVDPLTTSWSFSYTGDAGVSCTIANTSGLHPTVNCNDNATVTGVLTVSDGVWPAVTSTATVTIGNLPPTAGAVLTTPSNVAVGTTVNTGVAFNDPGTNDTHTATINWGDGTTTASVTESTGAGTASGTHAYSSPGVYTIAVTITDDNGGSVVATASSYISVFDPNAGFVTGSAHFTSPPGADPALPASSGDAQVGLEVKYQHPTDTTPSGHADFKYKTDSLEFEATSFSWLVVESSTKAYFGGVGTVNGVSGYSFLVSVIDGSPDRIRVKIWNTSTNALVYDSQPAAPDNASATTPVDTGSIQIHT